MASEAPSTPEPKAAKERRWPVIAAIAAVVLLVVGGPLLLGLLAPRYEPGEATGDDLDIRLVGVSPHFSNKFFDARGREIGDVVMGLNWSDNFRPDRLAREIVLETDRTRGEVFPESISVHPAGGTEDIGWLSFWPTGDSRNTGTLIAYGQVNREYERPFPGRWRFLQWTKRNVSVRAVDLTIRYWRGPRGPALYGFLGPFEPGREYAKYGKRYVQLTAARHLASGGTWFYFRSGGKLADDPRFCVYDRERRRHAVEVRSGSAESGEMSFVVPDLPPEKISLVTLGETPREVTLHNVAVAYPGRSDLEEQGNTRMLAEAFGLEKPAYGQRLAFQPESVDDIVFAAPLLYGVLNDRHMWEIEPILCREGAVESLSNADVRILRDVADVWLASPNEYVRIDGVTLGLAVSFHDYTDRAFELLGDYPQYVKVSVAASMRWHSKKLNASEIARIKQVLLDIKRGWSGQSLLFNCLKRCPAPQAAEALADLARAERPWLWWYALREPKTVDALGPPETWPPDLRARCVIANEFDPEGLVRDEADFRRADKMLPSALRGELAAGAHGAAESLLRSIARRLDVESATAAMVGFLRSVDEFYRLHELVHIIARYLNAHHGTDFAGLEGDIDAEYPWYYRASWIQTINEIIAWYDTAVLPSAAPPGYRVAVGDLRLVVHEKGSPESAAIALWVRPKTLATMGGVTGARLGDLWFAYSFEPVLPLPRAGWGYCSVIMDYRFQTKEKSGVHGTSPPLSRTTLPQDFPLDGDRVLTVEPAESATSVLSGTKVFEDWWKKYGPVGSE